MVSIIIPTYNEEAHISITLETVLALPGNYEVVVIDGGSSDHTLNIIRQFPRVRLYCLERTERAFQMNYGADQAKGQILWFLHADTLPRSDSTTLIENTCKNNDVVGGSHHLEFDQTNWPYRLLSLFTHFNCSLWTFGDQGIFVKKTTFDHIGGYPDMPILEDLELQLRLRRQGAFIKLSQPVLTSARRHRRYGVWREIFLDTSVVIGYFLGISPRRLKQWYQSRHRPK